MRKPCVWLPALATVLALLGCSHENDRERDAPTQEGEAAGTVTVTWEERPGEIMYFEGAMPDFVLTDGEGAVQRSSRSRDAWTWESLAPGRYTFVAGLYPCSGGNSCEPLGTSSDTCSATLVVEGEVHVHARLSAGRKCTLAVS